MAPPHPQTATLTGGHNIVVQNTGSHVVIQVGAHRLEAYSHQQYLSGYQAHGERGLLIAQLQGIPFYLPPREPDLLHLRDWLDSPNTISIRTLLGRAGTGKTRTAIEFVNREQSREDWNFGWLSGDELQRFIEHASLAGKIWTGNVCLILDYASASVDSLKKLLQQGLIHAQAGPGKLRLLLLDRSDSGWYASLLPLGHQQDAVKALFAGNDPRRLPSFVDVEHRRALLASALTHFRALKNQSDLTVPTPGEDSLFDQRLKNAEPWGDPLFLILAAAASAQLGLDRALSMSRTELARFAAGHEADRLYHMLPGAPLRHMVALVTLAGGASSTEARKAIKSERERLGWPIAATDLLDRLKTALPGADSSRLGKVEPDIIGEAFILDFLKTIPGEETLFLQAARNIDAAGSGQTLVHTIQNFALGAGAQVSATESTEQAERVLRAGEENLLIRLLSEYVERCSPSEIGTLWAIQDAIPLTSTSMSTLALSICDSLEKSVPNEDSATRLRLLNRKGIRLAAVGRNLEALAVSEQELALARQSLSRSGLAAVLNNRASFMNLLGMREEALSIATESLEIRRELAKNHPERFRLDLVTALNTQSTMLSDVGKRDEALVAMTEALQIFSDLPKQDDGIRAAQASLLHNQATLLIQVGSRNAALTASTHAVEIRRELAQAQPETFRADLAMSLANRANILSELGRHSEAEVTILETLEVLEGLAEAQPDAFLPDLAHALNNRATFLIALQEREEALTAIIKAVKIYRRLLESQPESVYPDLAMSLNNHANLLFEAGKWDESMAANSEALTIFRRLAESEPERFRPDVAMALNTRSNLLNALEQSDDALDANTESLEIYELLAITEPDAFRPYLAGSLNNQANRFNALGNHDEALVVIEKAIEILSDLAQRHPARFARELAISLGVLGQVLSDKGKYEDASNVFQNGLVSLLSLMKSQPDAVRPVFNQLLQGWTNASRELGQPAGQSDELRQRLLLQKLAEYHLMISFFKPTPGESDDQP